MNDLKAPQVLHTANIYFFAACLALASNTQAQWSNLPTLNTPVSTALLPQLNSVATSDGAGGAIIAWVDNRFGLAGGGDIFAQRIDASGTALWLPDGLPICVAAGAQENPAIIDDGAGGAFIVWQDFRNGLDFNIYAQHISSAGVALWPADGVFICVAVGAQIWPMLTGDGAGGAIITWEDERAGPGAWNIYAQRVDALGALQWPPIAGSMPICLAPFGQFMPMIDSDGAGGAFITWYDFRGGIDDDIYVQHILGTGAPAVGWPPDGILVSGLPIAPGSQTQPVIVGDGTGGAIITWYDLRSGVDFDIYAQRVTGAGVPLWALGGSPVCLAPGDQELPKLVADGASGAIIAWNDGRPIVEDDIYAQRLNALGLPVWTPDGAPVCALPADQLQPKLISDGAGGAIIAWNDERTLPSIDIYAQRMSAAGAPQWGAPGVAISIAPGDQSWAFQFIPAVADGAGGAILSWTDARFGPATDIYVQRVNANGSIGPTPPDVVVSAPADDDTLLVGSNFDITWVASSDSGIASVTLEFSSDGGASYDTLATDEANDSSFTWTVPAPASDLCLVRVTAYDSNGIGGSATNQGFFHIRSSATAVGDRTPADRLSIAVYPIPFNPSANIEYVLPARTRVLLSVYSVDGRLVRTLVDAVEPEGAHRVTWDGRDAAGSATASGVYVLRIDAGANTSTRKLVLVK